MATSVGCLGEAKAMMWLMPADAGRETYVRIQDG